MSKLAYRRSTPNGLLPLNLSSTSSSLTTSVSNPLVSTFSSSSSSLPSFEVLTKVNSNPIDKPSTQTSPRYIRRTSSASLLSNNFGPIPYNRTPSITALPDSPSWVSRSRKSSAESSKQRHPTNALANPFVARQEGRRRDSESNITSSSSLLVDRRFSANGLVGNKLGSGVDDPNPDESQDIEELDSSWTSNNTTLTSTPSPINIIRGPKGSPVEAQISQKKLLSDQMVPFQYSASLGSVRVAPSKTSNRLYPPSTSRTREARRPRSAEAEMGIHREVKSSKSFREMEKDEALAEAVRRIVCVSASNSQERLEKVEPVLKPTSKSKSEKRTSVSSIALEFPDVPVRAPVERPGSSRGHRRPRTQEDRGQVKMTELKRKTSLSSPSVYKSLDQSPSIGKFSTAPSTPFSNAGKPSTPTSSTTSQVYSTPRMVDEEVLETISPAPSTVPPSAWRKSVQTLSSKRPVSVDLQTEIMARPSFDDLRATGQISGTKLDPPIQLVEKSFISSKRASITNIRSRVQSATSSPTSPLESIANFNAKKMNQRFSYSLSNSLEDELSSKKSQEFEQEQSCIHGEVDRSSTINFSRPISQGIEMENQVQAMLQKTPTQSSRREWKADNPNFTDVSDYIERNEDNKDSPSSLTSTIDTSYFDDIISSSTNTDSPLTSPEIESRSLPKSSMTVTRQHSNSTSTSSTADTASSSEGLLNVNRNGSGYSTSNSKAVGIKMGEKLSKKTSKKLGLNMMFKKVFGNSTSNKPAKSLAFKCSPTSSVVEEEEDAISRNRNRGGIPRLDTRISNDVVFPIMRETGQAVNNHFQRETLSDLPFDPFSSSRARESSSYESFQKSHHENPIRGLIRRSSSFTLSGGKRVLEARG